MADFHRELTQATEAKTLGYANKALGGDAVIFKNNEGADYAKADCFSVLGGEVFELDCMARHGYDAKRRPDIGLDMVAACGSHACDADETLGRGDGRTRMLAAQGLAGEATPASAAEFVLGVRGLAVYKLGKLLAPVRPSVLLIPVFRELKPTPASTPGSILAVRVPALSRLVDRRLAESCRAGLWGIHQPKGDERGDVGTQEPTADGVGAAWTIREKSRGWQPVYMWLPTAWLRDLAADEWCWWQTDGRPETGRLHAVIRPRPGEAAQEAARAEAVDALLRQADEKTCREFVAYAAARRDSLLGSGTEGAAEIADIGDKLASMDAERARLGLLPLGEIAAEAEADASRARIAEKRGLSLRAADREAAWLARTAASVPVALPKRGPFQGLFGFRRRAVPDADSQPFLPRPAVVAGVPSSSSSTSAA